MNKQRVAVLFGGVSSEHEVSWKSAATILGGLDEEKYEIYPIGITRGGDWFYCPLPYDQIADGRWRQSPDKIPCTLSPSRADGGFLLFEQGGVKPLPVDVVFPALHGKNGEDGTVQGLLELAGLPYVGCGVLSSAVCMDKAVANTLLDAAGVPRCEWLWAGRVECADFEALRARVEGRLPYPIFVKPANAGSSVGISKAADAAQLKAAVATALAEDDKVVFERFVDGQEVECAVIGNDTVCATTPGEILASAEFYTYDDKYVSGTSRTAIPARLSEAKQQEVRGWAEKAYRVLGCTGLARADFFVERSTGEVLCNELNTLPGFTAISMYPKLMEAAGTPLPRLLDRLITLAVQRREGRHG